MVFLAGTAAGARIALARAKKIRATPVWVDLAGALEDLPEARLSAPVIDGETPARHKGKIFSIAHPAAISLARLLLLVHAHSPMRRAIVHVFEPVSTKGQPGINELHEQMVALLAFQNVPQKVFDTQVAFNLLPRYGDAAAEALASVEERIERHLASLLAPKGVPLPSLRLIHAPVFHGYCASAWVEYERRPSVKELETVLAGEGVDVRTGDVEPPCNTGVAGHGGITVGEIAEDRNDPRGMWLWLAADHLRVAAENAVLTAGLAAGR